MIDVTVRTDSDTSLFGLSKRKEARRHCPFEGNLRQRECGIIRQWEDGR